MRRVIKYQCRSCPKRIEEEEFQVNKRKVLASLPGEPLGTITLIFCAACVQLHDRGMSQRQRQEATSPRSRAW